MNTFVSEFVNNPKKFIGKCQYPSMERLSKHFKFLFYDHKFSKSKTEFINSLTGSDEIHGMLTIADAYEHITASNYLDSKKDRLDKSISKTDIETLKTIINCKVNLDSDYTIYFLQIDVFEQFSASKLFNVAIQPMLSSPIYKRGLEKLKFDQYICQEKFDGERVIIKYMMNTFHVFHRSGSIINLPSETLDIFTKCSNKFIIDGELLKIDESGKIIPFTESASHKVAGQKLVIFDCLFYERSMVELGAIYRWEKLKDFIKPEFIAPCYKIESYETFMNMFNYIIKNKGEGLILKGLKSEYKFNSRKECFKTKALYLNPFTITAVIVGVNYGTNKNSTIFSVVHIAVKDGDDYSYCGKVAISSKENKAILNTLKFEYLNSSIVKAVAHKHIVPRFKVVVVGDSITKELKLRFPVFKSYTDDDAKLTTKDELLQFYNA